MKTKLVLLAGMIALSGGAILLSIQRHHPSASASSKTVPKNPSDQAATAGKIKAPTVTPLQSSIAINSGMSGVIRPIVDIKEDYQRRREAVERLSANLDPFDRDALFSFLLNPGLADKEAGEQAFKNLLMDRLCELDPLPSGLDDVLIQVYHNKQQDAVLRDYAVQHLVAYSQQAEITQQEDAQLQKRIQDSLWEALAETDSSIAGTALLGLTRLSDGRREVDMTRLRQIALRLANESWSSELTLSTAMQVSARLGIREVLPTLMRNAIAGETMALRISAIGGLGTLGAPEAKQVLNTILESNEERLKLPARFALRNIELKLHQATPGGNRN